MLSEDRTTAVLCPSRELPNQVHQSGFSVTRASLFLVREQANVIILDGVFISRVNLINCETTDKNIPSNTQDDTEE